MVLLNALLETSSCVYSEIMFTAISFFQKLIKGGGWNKGGPGGWKIFLKLISRGGEQLFGIRECSSSASYRSSSD